MGNKQSIQFNDFQVVRDDRHSKIVRNKLSKAEYQAFQVVLQEGVDMEKEFTSWGKRSNELANVLRVVNVFANEKGTCTSTRLVNVIVQYAPIKLTEYTHLTSQRGLSVAKEVIDGCRQIVSTFRTYFQFSQELVRFTKQGRCKVWYHTNLAMNTPLMALKQTEPDQKKEDQTVARVFQCIRSKIDARQLQAYDATVKGIMKPYLFIRTSRVLSRIQNLSQSIFSTVSKIEVRQQEREGRKDSLFSSVQGLASGLKEYVQTISPYQYGLPKKKQFKRMNIFQDLTYKKPK